MHICENLSVMEKLEILTDAAKYDVACTSSGVEKKNNGKGIGNAIQGGICHSFAADGRCISLLKILYSNECVYDCRYCINRSSNDVVRTSFTPEEVCSLTMEFYRRNYIEGLFLSSGIIRNPTYTMEQLCTTVMMLREVYNFGGYIHVKGIPGADPSVIEKTGWYADRMSVNLELPTTEGLKELCPHKSRKNILGPMKQIQTGITSNRLMLGGNARRIGNAPTETYIPEAYSRKDLILSDNSRRYVPAGQSTQMIVGATRENDYEIVSVAEALYKNFRLKRVFYSAFVNVNKDNTLPAVEGGPPLMREHRLYQADWLLRFYGFKAADLLTPDKPNFNVLIDPKCDWALRHLEMFPVEINRADYYTLLKVPGIGTKSARRIIGARRSARLNFEDLKRMGVVLKRALYFITCTGRMMYNTRLDEDYIVRNLVDSDRNISRRLGDVSYKQLSFLDDRQYADMIPESIKEQTVYGIVTGQI